MYAKLAALPLLVGALVFGGGALVAQGAGQETPLSGAEVQQMIGDHGAFLDAVIMVPMQRQAAYVLAADGSAQVVWLSAAGMSGRDSGTWRIDADQLCLIWPVMNAGSPTCGRLFKMGDNGYEFRRELSGAVIFSSKLRQ